MITDFERFKKEFLDLLERLPDVKVQLMAGYNIGYGQLYKDVPPSIGKASDEWVLYFVPPPMVTIALSPQPQIVRLEPERK